jgi:hypothetical protein
MLDAGEQLQLRQGLETGDGVVEADQANYVASDLGMVLHFTLTAVRSTLFC